MESRIGRYWAENQFVESTKGAESPQSQHNVRGFGHLLTIQPISDNEERYPGNERAGVEVHWTVTWVVEVAISEYQIMHTGDQGCRRVAQAASDGMACHGHSCSPCGCGEPIDGRPGTVRQRG